MPLSNKKSTPYPRVGLWKLGAWLSFRIESRDPESFQWVHLKEPSYALVFAERGDKRWRAIVKGQIVLIDKNTFWDLTYIPCDGDR